MALTTTEMLTLLAPEVAARADADSWLEIAATEISAAAWGSSLYMRAVCLLAAHMATLSPITAAASAATATDAGAVTARSAGKTSESYGAATAGVSALSTEDAMLATTKYGREYLRIRATRYQSGPRVVRV